MSPASGRPLCAVCVDLDPVSCYLDKRGLRPGSLTRMDAVYDEGLERFLQVFSQLGVHATFFAVGREAQRPAAAARLRRAAGAGHEIANHTDSHGPSLARLPDTVLNAEIAAASRRLEDAVGQPVLGFKAPGWNVTARMFPVLERLGYRYDSSLVPLPAKALTLWLARRAGVDMPVPLLDEQAGWPNPPAHPYRVDLRHPWRAGDAHLWEIPGGFAVRPPLPLNMTSLAMLGPHLSRLALQAYRLLHGDVVFTFHGLDLVDGRRSIGSIGLNKPGLFEHLQAKQAFVRRVLAALLRGRRTAPLRDLVAEDVLSSTGGARIAGSAAGTDGKEALE